MAQEFRPTPASIPPDHVTLRLNIPHSRKIPVHYHPLVRGYLKALTIKDAELFSEPIILRPEGGDDLP